MLNHGGAADGQWRLYNIAQDPGETRDLAAEMPDRLSNMLQAYKTYVSDNNVLPTPEGSTTAQEITRNGIRKRFGSQILVLVLTLLTLLILYIIVQQRNPGATSSDSK